MLISRTAEYALRAVVYLASQSDRACPRREISAATKVPPDYLSKILRRLVERGVLCVQRGAGGGYRLGKPPDALSVLEVVSAVDPVHRLKKCPVDVDEHVDVFCPLHEQLQQAADRVEQAFHNTVIRQLIVAPRKGRRSARCAFPNPPERRSRRR